jgi:hypothetical protein
MITQFSGHIGHYHFFKKASAKPDYALACIFPPENPVFNFMSYMAVSNNGAGYQLMEKGDEKQKIQKGTLCFYFTAINIDGIGNGLESVK